MRAWLVPSIVCGATACTLVFDADGYTEGRGGSVDAGDRDAASDAASVGPPPCFDEVDLLFVVDNSNSMAEEQASLVEQLMRVVETFASGDYPGGTRGTVRSLQVGVISTDMGTAGFRVPTCAEASFGDDGILRTEGNTAAGCSDTYPPVLSFLSASGDAASFATDISCVVRMGTGGCGFEQQLEATLKAVTPSTSGIRFHDGTTGHADGANRGFIRPDALLAIVLVSDEEDASASDPDFYNPMSATYSGDLNLRGLQNPDALHPISRYVEGLVATKGDPRMVVFSAIVGVPPGVVSGIRGTDYATILDHPDMQEMVDPKQSTRLRPSCNVPGRGLAFPPRRIVSVARDLEAAGAGGVVRSICQASFTEPVDSALALIGDALARECE